MIANPLVMPLAHRPILTALRQAVQEWLRVLDAGQDGPAGQLPGDRAARRCHD